MAIFAAVTVECGSLLIARNQLILLATNNKLLPQENEIDVSWLDDNWIDIKNSAMTKEGLMREISTCNDRIQFYIEIFNKIFHVSLYKTTVTFSDGEPLKLKKNIIDFGMLQKVVCAFYAGNDSDYPFVNYTQTP